MARSTNLGSSIPPPVRAARSREPFERILTAGVGGGTASVAIPDAVEGVVNLPTMTVGVFDTSVANTGVVGLLDFPCAKLLFGGTDAADEDYTYQLALWSYVETLDLYIPQVVATGKVTLGIVEYAVSGTTYYLADAITNTLTSKEPGVYVFTPDANNVAYILADTRGAEGLSLQVSCTTGATRAATAEILLQRSENLDFGFYLSS